MADLSSLQQKVNALKAQVEQSSITPISLGSILDEIILTTVKNASDALTKANQAITASQSANNIASSAAGIADAALPRIIDITDLDTMGTDGSRAEMLLFARSLSGHTRYAIFYGTATATAENPAKLIGTLDVFTDSTFHVLTQVIETHHTIEDGELDKNSSHNCSVLNRYYRSYNLTNGNFEVARGEWTAWKECAAPIGTDGKVPESVLPAVETVTVSLRPGYSEAAPEALREVIRKHVAGERYVLRVKLSDTAQIDPDHPIIPDVPVVPGETGVGGIAALSDAAVIDEGGVSPQADNDGGGLSISLGRTFEVFSTKDIAGFEDGESGIRYELLSVERSSGKVTMYFCTMTVHYNEDLTEVSVSLSPIASEAIFEKQEKLTDSEDIEVDGDRLTVTERAKRQAFIDMWNAAAGEYGGYNAETGFFELNGLTDITYEDALKIYSAPRVCAPNVVGPSFNNDLRTLICVKSSATHATLQNTFRNSGFEVLRLPNLTGQTLNTVFYACARLRAVYGTLSMTTIDSTCFLGMSSLEEISINKLSVSVSFKDSPRLSLESLTYMVTKAANTKAITITVHPDVFAKLTGDTSNAAAAALSSEELEQWMALVAAAQAKNITFVTA